MANVIAEAGSAIGKFASTEAVAVGKEAFAASRARRTPFVYELKKAAAARAKDVLHEGAEAGRYLARRPGRAATLGVSAAVMIAAYVMLRTFRV